jgi:hypothetical protein
MLLARFIHPPRFRDLVPIRRLFVRLRLSYLWNSVGRPRLTRLGFPPSAALCRSKRDSLQPRPSGVACAPDPNRCGATPHLPSLKLLPDREPCQAPYLIGSAFARAAHPRWAAGMVSSMNSRARNGRLTMRRARRPRRRRSPLRLGRLRCLGAFDAGHCKHSQRDRRECGAAHKGECGQSRASPVYVDPQSPPSVFADSGLSDN